MNSTDLALTPALEQAQLIRNKLISPLERRIVTQQVDIERSRLIKINW